VVLVVAVLAIIMDKVLAQVQIREAQVLLLAMVTLGLAQTLLAVAVEAEEQAEQVKQQILTVKEAQAVPTLYQGLL
jgi:hypothetical protein